MKRCCQCSIGAISPVPATKAMIQPVGQRDGQLYTTPSRNILVNFTIDDGMVWSVDGINNIDYLISQIEAGRPIILYFSASETFFSATNWVTFPDADIPYVRIVFSGGSYRLYDGGVTAT